jgi:hypothetical protein
MAEPLYYTAYMDETGHAAADDQHFCGMAGFLSTADKWQTLEGRWKQTLTRFGVDYMHMKSLVPQPESLRTGKAMNQNGVNSTVNYFHTLERSGQSRLARSTTLMRFGNYPTKIAKSSMIRISKASRIVLGYLLFCWTKSHPK